MPTIVISPFNVASFPEGGGHLWVYLQYVLGLRLLGCDVYPGATPIDGKVDQTAGTIQMTLPLTMLKALADVPAPARSPAEVDAKPGDRPCQDYRRRQERGVRRRERIPDERCRGC